MQSITPSFFAKNLLSTISDLRWGPYLKILSFGLILSILTCALIFERNTSLQLRNFLLLTFITACCLKEWINTPANWGRAKRSYQTDGKLWKAAIELIPTEFRGWFHTALKMQIACFRKPRMTSPLDKSNQAVKFTYLKNGMYTSLLAIAIVASLADIPFSQFLLRMNDMSAMTMAIIHAISITATLLTVTSLVGDKRLLGDGVHQVENQVLQLRLGVRARANVPLYHIESAVILNEKHAPMFNTDVSSMNVTPFDKPNLVLRLKEEIRNDANAWFEELGSMRSNIRTLRLYVDAPEKLIQVINKFKTLSL